MRPPNILLLFADQHRHDTIGAVNAPFMQTPNLDRLTREGCWFSNAYSPNPVCMPARHCLLTGTTSRFHGYTTNSGRAIRDYSLPTLPRLLARQGYVTAGIGKMHFCPPREHHGFDELHLMEELPNYREEDAFLRYLAENGLEDVRHIHGVRPVLYHEPQRSPLPLAHHGSSWVATRTMQFIRENKDRPFFCWTGWVHPHPPCALPEEFLHTYADSDLPARVPPARPPLFASSPCTWYGDADEEPKLRRFREAYYGAVSLIDHNVGRILDCLEQEGLAENTLVIYTSDHGEMMGDKGFYQKMLPYEASAHIPFIARWPGRIEAGSRRSEFIDLMDILPTCAQAAGIADAVRPQGLPGSSFLRLDSGRDRRHQWVESGTGTNRWIMQLGDRFKYVYWYNGGYEELFDLEQDPKEVNNLVGSDDCPVEALADLRARCLRNEVTWGLPDMVPEGRYKPFERHTFPEHLYSRFPIWSNQQFPDWGDGTPAEETALMEAEVRAACRDEPTVGPPHRIFDGEAWREKWLETWQKLGGRPELYRELFFGE